MDKTNSNITYASYLNDIILHFYEDIALVESTGKRFGIDINHDRFLALSFLYPFDTIVDYKAKEVMEQVLSPLIALSPRNKAIDSPQFIRSDKGILLLITACEKEVLSKISNSICDEAIRILDQHLPGSKIRIGIGTIETGLAGLEHTYRNAITAVYIGEKSKKERRVLDYIGMEIYSAINAMVLAYGNTLIGTILKQLSDEEQIILGKYYKCKEQVSVTASALHINEDEVLKCFYQIKNHIGLDVNDTEDNFKLHFIMIASRVLENG